MGKRRRLRALLLVTTALTMFLIGCGGGGGDGGDDDGGGGDVSPLDLPPVGDPNEPPAILSTTPPHGSLEVARDQSIRVQFAVPIDVASVQTNSIVVTGWSGPVLGVTDRRSGESIVTFIPSVDLPYGDVYRVTLRPGIRAESGQERTGAYTFAFRAVESTARTGVILHEFEPNDMRVLGLATNRVGDGVSVMQASNGLDSLHFRRVRDGVPTGPVEDIIGDVPSVGFLERSIDVTETGNAQCAWTHSVGPRQSAFVRRYDKSTDSWGEVFRLTPDAGVEALGVDSEVSNNGGLVAWLEQDVGDSDNARAFAGCYEEGVLSDVSQLGSSVGDKEGLMLSRRGLVGVVAFKAEDQSGATRLMAGRFRDGVGFGPMQQLSGANNQAIVGVEASFTGHLYVLMARRSLVNSDFRWHLAVAQPGQEFDDPIPLHDDFVGQSVAKMAVGDNGILTVVFELSSPDHAIWARRYTPTQGLSQAVNLSGVGPGAGRSFASGLGVRADKMGNAVAVMAMPVGDLEDNGQTIRAALLPVGKPWTVGIELADETSEEPPSHRVRVALEPSGAALVAWISERGVPPLKTVLRTRRLRTDGSLGSLSTFDAATVPFVARLLIESTDEGQALVLFDRIGSASGGRDDVLQVLFD